MLRALEFPCGAGECKNDKFAGVSPPLFSLGLSCPPCSPPWSPYARVVFVGTHPRAKVTDLLGPCYGMPAEVISENENAKVALSELGRPIVLM